MSCNVPRALFFSTVYLQRFIRFDLPSLPARRPSMCLRGKAKAGRTEPYRQIQPNANGDTHLEFKGFLKLYLTTRGAVDKCTQSKILDLSALP